MLHVGHAGSVGDIINDDVLREHGFPVIEDLPLRVRRCSGEQVDNILQQLADGLWRDGLLFCLDTERSMPSYIE